MNLFKINLLCLNIIVIFILFLSINVSYGVSKDVVYFDKDSNPYGISYGEWSAKWWKWIMSIPIPDNPRLDETGSKCGVNQNEENVWFLAQISGGYVERHCTIPSEKSIFVPILTGECDYLTSPDVNTEEGLRECAQWGIKNSLVKSSLNGTSITDKIERVSSPLFNFTLIPNNIFSSLDSTTGSTGAVLDGYYIFIKSLPVGINTLEFSASGIDNPIIGTTSFSYSVKYILDIT